MDSRPLRLRPAGHLLIVVSIALAGVIVALPTRSVAAGSPSPVIAGEKISISGKVPGGKRPVVLQRYLQDRWTRVTTSRTSSRGRYSFTVVVPNRSASYRVVAPRTRVAGRIRPAKISKVRHITVRAQSAALAFPSVVVEGRPTAVRTSFSPARAGRPVALQKLVGGSWVAAGTTVQDSQGRASFTVAQHETTTYRAITVPWRGAAARGTAPRTAGVTPPPPGGPWVTGYYAGWFWDQMYPPERVDMSAMTHFVFGRVAPGAGSLGGPAGTVVEAAGTAHDPGLSPDGTRSVEDYLVKKAHDSGAKALLMLGGDGNDGAGFMLSSTDAERAAFVERVVDYLVEHDYDGVDVDWENCLDGARGCGEAASAEPVSAEEAQRRLLALLTDLRAEADSRARFATTPVLVTFPGYPVNLNFLTGGKVEPWQVDVAARVDQYNLMSYGIGTTWSGAGWLSWFSGALTGATARTPVDIESSIAAYVRSGVPRSRIGIGIGFYGIYFGPKVTGPRQDTSHESIYEVNDVALSYAELVRKGYLSHGKQLWDEAAQSTYRTYGGQGYVPSNDPRSNPAGFLSYEDARSIAAKGQWVKDTGVGGTIIWTLNYGWVPSSRTNPLLDAVKRAFLPGS